MIDNKKIDYDRLPRKKILCVDMKAFYASIEAVARDLDPGQVCLAVIGDKKREGSVVLAASPALKEKYNLSTGNRFFEIPDNSDIIIVEARMGLYLEISMQITRLFNKFVPLEAIHVYSIDESWLKLDGTGRLLGNKWQVARMIKKAIFDRFGLRCSMGLGPNMFLAKVAMDIEGKKEGLVEWTYEDVPDKLWPVSLKECWGIGSRLTKRLNRVGVKTVGDLARLPLEYLENKFGLMGSQLYYHAWGVDLSKLEGHYDDKPRNLGRGITLLRDYREIEEIKTVIFELSEVIARRCRKRGLVGKTVSLGIGFSRDERANGFHVQHTLTNYTDSSFTIYNTCCELLTKNYDGQVVRKVNVSLGNFVSYSLQQLNLFSDDSRENKIDKTRDEIQKKFGSQALFYGRCLKKGSIRKRITTTIGGHKT